MELKPLTIHFAVALHKLVQKNKKRLIRYFPITYSSTESVEKAKIYLENNELFNQSSKTLIQGIFEDEKLVGIVFFKSFDWRIPKCELAYFIGKEFEGKGITTKAILNATQFGFEELNLNKLYIRIDPANKASIKVAEKCGYKLEGKLRKEFKIETGELVDLFYFGKLKSD